MRSHIPGAVHGDDLRGIGKVPIVVPVIGQLQIQVGPLMVADGRTGAEGQRGMASHTPDSVHGDDLLGIGKVPIIVPVIGQLQSAVAPIIVADSRTGAEGQRGVHSHIPGAVHGLEDPVYTRLCRAEGLDAENDGQAPKQSDQA